MLSTSRAAIALWSAHRHLTLQRHRFLITGIDVNCTRRVLSGFSEIATLEKDSTEQNVSVNHFGWWVPEDGSLERGDCCLLIATTLIYSTAEKECFGVSRLNYQDLSDLCQRLVIPALLVKIANLISASWVLVALAASASCP